MFTVIKSMSMRWEKHEKKIEQRVDNKTVTEKVKGRDQYEDVRMDAKIILKYIVKK